MSARWLVPLAVFVLALGLRVAHVVEQHDVVGLDLRRLPGTAAGQLDLWARSISDGDLLSRDQPRSLPQWKLEIASPGRWLEWAGHERTLHAAPLLPYVAALAYRVAGSGPLVLAIGWALLGALTCALVAALGQRFVGRRAGLLGGALAAFTGPLLALDTHLVPEGPLALALLVAVALIDRARTSNGSLSWLAAGGALGLITLVRTSGVFFLLVTVLALCLGQRRGGPAAHRPGAALLLGFALALTPVVVRNALVQAPLTTLHAQGPEHFIAANVRGQPGVGWKPPLHDVRALLMESNARCLPAWQLTLLSHRGDPPNIARMLGRRVETFVNGHELADDVDFASGRRRLASLKLAPVTVTLLFPLALLGVVVGLRRRRRLLVAYLALGAVIASVLALNMTGRLRAPALPLMALFAGVGLDGMLSAWSSRRRLSLVAGGLLLAVAFSWSWPPSPWHPDDDVQLLLNLARSGQFDVGARHAARLAATEAAATPPLATALAAWNQLGAQLAEPEGSAARALTRGRGLAALVPIVHDPFEMLEIAGLATSAFELALERQPFLVGAHHGLGTTLRAVASHPTRQRGRHLGPALSEFSLELRDHPDHGPSHRDAGIIRLLWGEMRGALEHLLQAERLGVVDLEVLAGIARTSCEQYLRDEPPIVLDDVALDVYDPLRALAFAERALAMAPDNAIVIDIHVTALVHNERYEDATAVLLTLLESHPEREATIAPRLKAIAELAGAAEAQDDEAPRAAEPSNDDSLDSPPGG